MQTTVNSQMVAGLAGQLYGLSHSYDIRGAVNNSKKYVKVVVTAANSVLYTVTINGTAISDTSDADATKAEIVDLLVAAINAESEPVTAIDGGDDLLLQADVGGVDFTLELAAAGAGDLVATVLIGGAETVPFGVFVCQDLNEAVAGMDAKAHLPTLTTDVTGNKKLGITVMTQALEQANPTSGNVGYAIRSSMSYIRKGMIYASPEQAVVPADPVFVRFVAGATEQLGALRMDADTADAVQLPNCYWRTTAGANGLAVVEINLP